MKTLIYCSLFFALSLLNSCANEVEDKLVGEWKLVDIDYGRHLEEISPELRNEFITMSERQKQNVLGKTFFFFKSEGVLEMRVPKYGGGESKLTGDWRLNENNDSLFLDYGDQESYALYFEDDGHLILESGEKPLLINTLVKE